MVAIVQFEGDKVARAHRWDQASLLVQIGLPTERFLRGGDRACATPRNDERTHPFTVNNKG